MELHLKIVIFLVLVSATAQLDLSAVHSDFNSSMDICPTWYHLESIHNSSNESCKCGSEFSGLLRCDRDEESISVLRCNCMTTDENGLESVGQCLYTCSKNHGNDYITLPKNTSDLNSEVCSPFHREGVLCGRCEQGYGISAFSVELLCVECSSSNWLEYFAVTLLPLTFFYFIILVFRFRATSPWLDAYILYSQVIASPGITRLLLYGVADGGKNVPVPIVVRLAQTAYGIWNLNFFQLLVPSFCIDPKLSALNIVALGYLTAFYPLILVLVSYIVIELYAHNFKPLVILWKPFRRVAILFNNKVSLETSIVDVFATFLLLSYVKFIYVSSDLLNFVRLRYPNGEISSPVWVYNGSISYFGSTHAGFGALAVVVSLIFIAIPFFFLFIYPFKFFQRNVMSHLDKLKPQIQAFVDCFQGHYKDGTNGSRDYRYFSAAYLLIRVFSLVITQFLISGFAVAVGGLMILSFAMTVFLFKPYKRSIHTTCNGVILLLMTMWLMSLSLYTYPYANIRTNYNFAVVMDLTFCLLPLFYFVFLVIRYFRREFKMATCTCISRDKLKTCFWRLLQGKRERQDEFHEERANRQYSFADRVVNPNRYRIRHNLNFVAASTALPDNNIINKSTEMEESVCKEESNN